MNNLNTQNLFGKTNEQSNASVIKYFQSGTWFRKIDLSLLLPLPKNLTSTGFNSSRLIIDGKDVVNVPDVNGILSEYARDSLQIQYTIEFIEFVNQQFGLFSFSFGNEKLNYAVNLYKTVTNDSMMNFDEVKKTLSFYLDSQFSLMLLKSSLANIEKNYRNRLTQIAYVYQNKTIKLSEANAAGFINLANIEIEKDLNVYFANAKTPAAQIQPNSLANDPRFYPSLEDARWNEYDDTIKSEIASYNNKFSGIDAYTALDWRMVKAMVWTEVLAGPKGNPAQWTKYPLQIGRFASDPGYLVVKSGKENSDLITSADLRRQIQTDVTGKNNIKAGIAYLYTRAIKDKVDTREVIENAAVQEYKIVKGDTTDAVAKKLGTTRDNIMRNSGLNSVSIGNLLPGQTIKFQKARIERYITGWNDWSNTVKAYNGGGDANYMEKVERAFQIITSRTSN